MPERPRTAPSAAAPSAAADADTRADKKVAAQRADDKRMADRRLSDALAQLQRERQLREKLEQDKRRLESDKAELERRLRIAELARAAAVPAVIAAAAPVPPAPPQPAVQAAAAAVPAVVARHPHLAQPLAARQTFVDSWGQGSLRESAPRMVAVPPAPASGFLMGSPQDENGRDLNEKQHRVYLHYAFALGETEVTLAQWDACVSDGGCGGVRIGWARGRDQYPVANVNWSAARAYIDWLNSRLGLARDDPYRYRLPSEAEWEYAARAGSSGPFGFAQNRNIGPDLANYDSRKSFLGSPTRDGAQDTVAVGSYAANGYGLKDMAGNVWEWLADCYEPDYDRTPRDGSAHRENDNSCGARVVRGGSWAFPPDELRSANRFWAAPGYRDNKGGFRIARTLLPPG